ncbi:MAG: fatty acid kinase fatty acid binding subunit [Actinomycetota bacterium]|jgi:DegV family protein with EDD domain|nr:fatty acid kinase fatty acid binding subunit [Actinomycetota bacterium]
MAVVRVVTDSSCDLPVAVAQEHGIIVVPLSIRFGEEEFVDGRDLTPSAFWAKSAASAGLPSTAAPSPGAFEEAFRSLAGAGASGVVCINLSSKLSATIQAAETAAKALAGDIPVRAVDSKSVSLGLGTICIAAAKAGAAGASVDEIVALAEDMGARTRIHATLDTLENLKKGGRIGAAKALMGTMLSVKPVIEVVDGAVEAGPKVRTRSKALQYLVDRVTAEPKVENLAVLHGDAPDVEQFLELLAPHFPRDQIVVGQLGAVVGSHTGPRTIGVAFQVPR